MEALYHEPYDENGEPEIYKFRREIQREMNDYKYMLNNVRKRIEDYGYHLGEIEKCGLENVKTIINDIENRKTKFIMDPTNVPTFSSDELINP